MLSRSAAILMPHFLTLLSRGRVNRVRRRENGDPAWAEPLTLDGVPNFYRLNADLYRSGQPTANGFRNLAELGIRSCISLRAHRSDRNTVQNLPIQCVWHPIPGSALAPEKLAEILRDLQILPKPVLVHCYQGADRTGLICAACRILFEGWSCENAVREMTCGGFGYHWFYRPYITLLQELDLGKMPQNETARSRKGEIR